MNRLQNMSPGNFHGVYVLVSVEALLWWIIGKIGSSLSSYRFVRLFCWTYYGVLAKEGFPEAYFAMNMHQRSQRLSS